MASSDRPARDARTSIWLADRRAPQAQRRARPADGQPNGLDLGKIVDATVRLLDEEGLAKLSMRRLAAALGVTAMSVYWYVDTKDELLELALDRVHGEMRLPSAGGAPSGDAPSADPPPAPPDDWRVRLRALACEHRRMLVTHPWVSRLAGEYLNVGPHAVAFSDAAQQAIRGSGLPPESRMGALSLLFQFTYGFGTVEGRWAERCRAAGISEDEYYREILSRLRGRPEYGAKVAATDARPSGTAEEMRERDFAFALDCAMAGIAAMSGRGSGPTR